MVARYPATELTGGFPIEMSLDDPMLEEACDSFMQALFRDIEQRRARLTPGDKVSCGSWALRFCLINGKLIAFDAKPGLADFVEGASFSIGLWKSQYEVCRTHGSLFVSTPAYEFISLHDDVLTGTDEALIGYRYWDEAPHSGWWIAPHQYDGREEAFSKVHPSHVDHLVVARPDLVRFLGLTTGFCFKVAGKHDDNAEVWFDQASAGER